MSGSQPEDRGSSPRGGSPSFRTSSHVSASKTPGLLGRTSIAHEQGDLGAQVALPPGTTSQERLRGMSEGHSVTPARHDSHQLIPGELGVVRMR